MRAESEIILSLALAVGIIIVNMAVAEHIKNAQIVEFKTPHYNILSTC